MVARASGALARARACTTRFSVAAESSGVSPERMAMGPCTPRSAPRAASTAWAVPRCSAWRANLSGAPGRAARSAASTASAWWPTTTTTGEAPASSAARMGNQASGLPASWWSTLAVPDFMRVPLPAARTTAASG